MHKHRPADTLLPDSLLQDDLPLFNLPVTPPLTSEHRSAISCLILYYLAMLSFTWNEDSQFQQSFFTVDTACVDRDKTDEHVERRDEAIPLGAVERDPTPLYPHLVATTEAS